MSSSASQAAAFYKDVAKLRKVWGVRDSSGILAPMTSTGKRSMPFWSTKSRADKIVKNVHSYNGFEVFSIDLDKFMYSWISGISNDGFLIGVNWSGANATGYDVEPSDVLKNIEHQLSKIT
ncbi:DUF2750 domain-containing protein [Vibrio vulnificus]|uniref:DUF2750 domain-containing protein n=1 Tax=Vibrio vulnificus TaxID=672 RepID=UPI000CD2535A|nr:DUF2750 domain-containing protein [Vibrio vulnificus]EHD2237066.1 DUF2750 domain-containing protein [Vibrio vulnificus]EHK9068751.1 DUF2750 domain-containing protein [Vibrio vulnificus]EHU4802271.1 DUF2750 domain-containing protein [Vibrio vulnificus]EHZ2497778.1 DUF2750 domain-containing protein [Vibrio vulnificus]EIA0806915.1 DUF2750 domain-containing protein [Vibrio vulnificus]